MIGREVIAGFPISWRQWGQGPRRALMAHCSLAHGGEWSAIAARLGDVFTMTAPDLPAHGNSGDWDAGMGDYHTLATAVLRQMAAEEGEPVDLIGHSLGGTLMLRLALENPGLARSLILIEPVLFAAVPEEVALRDNGPFDAAWAAGDRQEAARRFMAVWGAGQQWDDLPARQRSYLIDRMHVIPGTVPALGEDSAGMLVPGRLETLTCPVLLLRGGITPASAFQIIDALAARIRNARIATIPGAGHMLTITHPEQVSEAIRSFAGAPQGR